MGNSRRSPGAGCLTLAPVEDKMPVADPHDAADSRRRIGRGSYHGAVSEWLKGPHWKCGVRVTAPRVRIPPAPVVLRRSAPGGHGSRSRRLLGSIVSPVRARFADLSPRDGAGRHARPAKKTSRRFQEMPGAGRAGSGFQHRPSTVPSEKHPSHLRHGSAPHSPFRPSVRGASATLPVQTAAARHDANPRTAASSPRSIRCASGSPRAQPRVDSFRGDEGPGTCASGGRLLATLGVRGTRHLQTGPESILAHLLLFPVTGAWQLDLRFFMGTREEAKLVKPASKRWAT